MLASRAIDRAFELDRVKPKTIKLLFAAFLLGTHHEGVRANTGWLRMRIMFPNGTTCPLSTVVSMS